MRLKALLFLALGLFFLLLPRGAEGEPFGLGQVQDKARQLSQQPYHLPDTTLPEELDHLSYDQIRDLRWQEPHALWANAQLPFQVKFFHRTNAVREAVKIYVCAGDQVTPFPYSSSYFNFGKIKLTEPLTSDLGYAGFRIHYAINQPAYLDEVLVFLGASYFRSLAKKQIYGLSARGLAINSGISGVTEEFPNFTTFWLEQPLPGATKMTIFALLDSPSVTGAYQFQIEPGVQTKMEIHSTLFFRQAVAQLGIAPLTSMFWYGENSSNHFGDFRPEVHDSDGALLVNSQGQWHWRPLQHVDAPLWNREEEVNPRGFGLLQRDRNFQSYEDLEANYPMRPSAWVTPLGDWGKGTVSLLQLPTQSEFNDNIVLFWQPARAPQAGDRLDFNYQLAWYGQNDQLPPLATCARTLIDYPTPSKPQARILLDFVGPSIEHLTDNDLLQPVFSTGSGDPITDFQVMKNPYDHSCRVSFLVPSPDQPLELSCQLQDHGRPISETWDYNWIPENEIHLKPEQDKLAEVKDQTASLQTPVTESK